MSREEERPAASARKTRQPAPRTGSHPAFAGILRELVPPPRRELPRPTLETAPLAHCDYAVEVGLKEEALRLFWARHEVPGRPEGLVPSPRPRAYRTTSKRKTLLHGGVLYLLFGETGPRAQKKAFLESPLEPPEHAGIYRFLQQRLSEASFRPAAIHMNYLIIRGSYGERAVIFNVDAMNGPLIRKLKILAGQLQRMKAPTVSAAFVYCDPTRSDYYLESRRPSDGLGFKKLFGRESLAIFCGETRYLYHPTSFSQVNESMVPVVLERARELLEPDTGERLLDLYCGYGLFSHFLAPHYRQVIGIDAEGPSIRAAEANRRLNPGSANARFLARRISGETLEGILPLPTAPESILLDPPRQGPEAATIAVLARRRPRAVLHIFCGVDQIPSSLRQWEAGGYGVVRVVPLDMFPGTANLEVLVLLKPAS